MLKVNIKTGNAIFTEETGKVTTDFGGRCEISRLLRKIADSVESGSCSGVVIELNGNRCGEWTLTNR